MHLYIYSLLHWLVTPKISPTNSTIKFDLRLVFLRVPLPSNLNVSVRKCKIWRVTCVPWRKPYLHATHVTTLLLMLILDFASLPNIVWDSYINMRTNKLWHYMTNTSESETWRLDHLAFTAELLQGKVGSETASDMFGAIVSCLRMTLQLGLWNN